MLTDERYWQSHFIRRDISGAEIPHWRRRARNDSSSRELRVRRVSLKWISKDVEDCYAKLFTFCRMDRKLQCNPSSTRQHLVYLLAVDAKTSLSDRVRDAPCIMQNSLEFSDGCSKPGLSSARAPNGGLAWVRAVPFRPRSDRRFIQVPDSLWDPPSSLAIFKFARVQWQRKFSIIGFLSLFSINTRYFCDPCAASSSSFLSPSFSRRLGRNKFCFRRPQHLEGRVSIYHYSGVVCNNIR